MIRKRRIGALAGLADEALLSLTTFLAMIILSRGLAPDEFGRFSLLFLFAMFSVSVQTALITQPHHVIEPSLSAPEARRYSTALAVYQGTLAGAFLLLGLGAALVLPIEPGYRSSIVLISFSTIAIQYQEFFRRLLYTQNRRASALFNDTARSVLLLAALVFLWQRDALTIDSSVLALGGSAAVAAGVGLLQTRALLAPNLSRSALDHALKGNWAHGKWLLGSTTVLAASAFLYPVAALLIVGPVGVAGYRVVDTLLGPTNIFIRVADTSFAPNAARIWRGPAERLKPYIVKLLLGGSVPLALGAILVFAIGGDLLGWLFGPAYREFAPLLAIMAVANILVYAQIPLSVGLRAQRIPRRIWNARVVSTITAFSVGLVVMYLFGINGIGYARILAELAGFSMLWLAFSQANGALRRQAVTEGAG